MQRNDKLGYLMKPTDRVSTEISVAALACKVGAQPVVMKKFRPTLLSVTFLFLAACSILGTSPVDEATGFLKEVPPQVVLLAAPYQNLREVILNPEDGCYWYRHVGPVETTMLPLRTTEGRPICTAAST
jgi:hypothetical protein